MTGPGASGGDRGVCDPGLRGSDGAGAAASRRAVEGRSPGPRGGGAVAVSGRDTRGATVPGRATTGGATAALARVEIATKSTGNHPSWGTRTRHTSVHESYRVMFGCRLRQMLARALISFGVTTSRC